jgi:hypothetical protein
MPLIVTFWVPLVGMLYMFLLGVYNLIYGVGSQFADWLMAIGGGIALVAICVGRYRAS